MIPDCDGRSDGRTESIIAKTALCIASYADALSKMTKTGKVQKSPLSDSGRGKQANTAHCIIFTHACSNWELRACVVV